jgi:hypothetical protein
MIAIFNYKYENVHQTKNPDNIDKATKDYDIRHWIGNSNSNSSSTDGTGAANFG